MAIIRYIKLSLLLLSNILLSVSGYCNAEKEPKHIIPGLNPGNVHYSAVEGGFKSLYKKTIDNRSTYIFTPPRSGLKYHITDNHQYTFNLIEIFNKEYLLVTTGNYKPGKPVLLLKSNPGHLKLFNLSLNENKYLVIIHPGFQAGSYQYSGYITLFNITDMKNIIYYSLYSLWGAVDLFGDYNNDGSLDFASIDYHKPGEEIYNVTIFSEGEREFYPLDNNGKDELLITGNKSTGFHLLEKSIEIINIEGK